MSRVFLVALVVLLLAACESASDSAKTAVAPKEEKQPFALEASGMSVPLEAGYYLRVEFVDLERRTYSLHDVWDNPPMFADLKVSIVDGGLLLGVGSLHEGVFEFGLNKAGKVMSAVECGPNTFCQDPCLGKACVTAVEIDGPRSIWLSVDGQRQHFVSVQGFKRVEPASSN